MNNQMMNLVLHDARAQAKYRANREKIPMCIYKALLKRPHDTKPEWYFYVRSQKEHEVMGDAELEKDMAYSLRFEYVDTIYPDTLHKETRS